MRAAEQMESYVRKTKLLNEDNYDIRVSELNALYDTYQTSGLYRAFILAFNFGRAKGFRMANKGKSK